MQGDNAIEEWPGITENHKVWDVQPIILTSSLNEEEDKERKAQEERGPRNGRKDPFRGSTFFSEMTGQ